MAKSQDTFNKKEKEKKRLKKRQYKQNKKEKRKANSEGGGIENMMSYVDEDGYLTNIPPDPTKEKKVIKAENIEIGIPRRKEKPLDTIRTGKVEFFNDSKGYGFIKEQDTEEKFFFHINGLIDDIQEGNKVSFELIRGMKGMNAVKVKKT